MKKKVTIISLLSIIIVLLLSFILIIELQPDEIKEKNKLKADEYSKIETFLRWKKDDYHLKVWNIHKEKYFYIDKYILDENDCIFNSINDLVYNEIENKNEKGELLYEIRMAEENKSTDEIRNLEEYPWIYIYTNNTICTSIFVGESFSMVSKTRTYLLNDEDYEKLTNELNNFYKNLEVQND